MNSSALPSSPRHAYTQFITYKHMTYQERFVFLTQHHLAALRTALEQFAAATTQGASPMQRLRSPSAPSPAAQQSTSGGSSQPPRGADDLLAGTGQACGGVETAAAAGDGETVRLAGSVVVLEGLHARLREFCHQSQVEHGETDAVGKGLGPQDSARGDGEALESVDGLLTLMDANAKLMLSIACQQQQLCAKGAPANAQGAGPVR